MPPRSPPYQPPLPPPPTGSSGTSGSPRASGSSQVSPPPPPPPSTNQEACTTTDIRLRPSVSSTPEDLHMDDDMAPDAQVHSSDDEDIENAHIPKVNLRQDWWKPLEEDRLATPVPAWSIPLSGLPVPKNNWASDLASTYSPPPKDLLHAQTGDMTMFMDCNCYLNHLPPKDKKILTTVVNLWTRHLVIKQCVKDFQLRIKSYQTQLNLTKPRWDATGFEYKHYYTVIDSPRAVTFRDKYGVQMIMRFNEIHKFSDGTVHQIDEALDYRVKEFKVNRMNLGLNTRFWTRKDVDRSKSSCSPFRNG
uniref:Uncharacterized protein n=1 Tax=Tanacetum cinerariifolium TaxID=118510 RepID=A0A699JB69_TANCI|nr:hypothetical protein [Tanacetum cinerariifolium]